MKKTRLLPLFCLLLLLAGCATGGATGNVYHETYQGTIVRRFAEGSGEDTVKCVELEVDSGEDTAEPERIVFTLIESSSLPRHWEEGDQVLIECESYTNSDYRPILSMALLETVVEEEEGTAGDWLAMVMVRGRIYKMTGESDIDGRCGVMDGEITSQATGIPKENDQSNFGTGYGYQYVDEYSIDVYFPEENEGTWMRFETEQSAFYAAVLEVHETYLLVETCEYEDEQQSSNRIEVSMHEVPGWDGTTLDGAALTEDSVVYVVYSGGIAESYPAQIFQVDSVSVITNEVEGE